jgi:hypothetical protein
MSVVTEEVRLFVCDRVQSVEGLEVLRRAAAHPSRSWSPGELALDLCLSQDSVEDAVDALVESGLLGKGEDGSYRYRPGSERFDEMVQIALQAYHEHPSAVVQCLTNRAMRRMRVSLIRLTERLLDRARF